MGTRVVLSDGASHNGTFVNGEAISSQELFVGDVVRIGNWVGVFTRGDVRASVCENVTTEEAAPRSLGATWFCVQSTRFCIIMPTPAPVTVMKPPIRGPTAAAMAAAVLWARGSGDT